MSFDNQPASFDYISPLSLLYRPDPQKSFQAGIPLSLVHKLEPGKEHQLSQDIIPTAQSIIDGTYQEALNRRKDRDIVHYLPRLPEYSTDPGLSIVFTFDHGRPGPCLMDFTTKYQVIDNPSQPAFADYHWNRTGLTIDWPGILANNEYISCVEGKGYYTRGEVAKAVADRIIFLLTLYRTPKSEKTPPELAKLGPQRLNPETSRWNAKYISLQHIRLIAINYYRNRKTWVPVLAMDADGC